MQKSNWLDNVLGFFSPAVKAQRLRARLVSDILEKSFQKRRYEGAAMGNRTSGWFAPATSANTEIGPAIITLRNRSRDLVRNNAYAKRGIQVVRKNVVGSGIITQVKAKSSAKANKFHEIWKNWALETYCDYDGMHDIYGLQGLVMNTVAESGECLIRLRRASSQDVKKGLPVPVQLQVLEGDFLNHTLIFAEAAGGNIIYQGVEFDPTGRRAAYHLWESHPGETLLRGRNYRTIRVPADEVLHIYDITRPGQIRGVPWLAAALLKMRDLDDYEDAQLTRQKIAACFTAFIEDAEMPETQSAGNDRGELGKNVEPGLIEILPPGKKVTFGNPPGVQGYKEFTSTHLQAIASALGITYEALTGDLSQVNFSSGRMGWLEMQRNIDDWQQRIMLGRFMRPMFQWFMNGCELVGMDTVGVKPDFTPPRREMIDPTREIPAIVDAIRGGLLTLPEAIRMFGGDLLEHLVEISVSNDLLDKYGLILDSDPRRVMLKGKRDGENNPNP